MSTLFALWKQMRAVRRFEEHVIEQYAEQNALFARKVEPPWSIRCPTHLSIGQEAAAVGACAPLTPADQVYSTHRCHAHYLAKGGDPARGMAELYGKATGCANGKGGSMHLVDASVGMMGASAIVGGSIPLAVGAGLAFRLRGEPRVAVAFFGDGAVEQGVFAESLHLAALQRLPVIFACENNHYATLSHLETRQHRPISDRARAVDIPAVDVDGNDVAAVANASREAVARARAGEGPTLIVADTYRWYAHVGTEPDTGKMRRSADELDAWRARDPVAAARAQLLASGVTEQAIAEAEADVEAALAAAVRFARESPAPAAEALWTDV